MVRWVFQAGWPELAGPDGFVMLRIDAKASGESGVDFEKVVTMVAPGCRWTHDRRIANTRDGKPVLVKLPAIDLVEEKEGKPVGIQSRIGRRPIAAFGNSDGDLQMLEWTMAGTGPRFALFVHHDDSQREYAYDRADRLQQFSKGWDEAIARGWTVVSMKDDWSSIFPAAK